MLCVSIHDVAPATWPDCLRLVEAIRAVADIPLTWLVVPHYHFRPERSAAMEAGLDAALARGDELALHGYSHLDTEASKGGLRARFLRNVYTRREGEFANAQNAAGVPDQIRNLYNRALSGQRLNPNQRADFIAQAQGIYTTRSRRYSELVQEYRGYAAGYGVNPDRIATVPAAPAPAKQTAAPKVGEVFPRTAHFTRSQLTGFDGSPPL